MDKYKLVNTVVNQLPKTTTSVDPPGLLSVDGVASLVPKDSQTIKKPHMPGQNGLPSNIIL